MSPCSRRRAVLYCLFALVEVGCICFIASTAMPPLTELQLVSMSRDIRDVLARPVKESNGSCIGSETVVAFNTFFSNLLTTTMTLQLFRRTRIHFALLEITSPDSAWPEQITSVARLVLKGWTESFGPLDDIEDDIWAPGGRMHGVHKLIDYRKTTVDWRTDGRAEQSGWIPHERELSDDFERMNFSTWSIEGPKGDEFSMRVGHIGFNVGEYESSLQHQNRSLTCLAGGSSPQRRIGTASSTERPAESLPTTTKPSPLLLRETRSRYLSTVTSSSIPHQISVADRSFCVT